ncbi:response regulator transcription factor [Thalassococcus sp. CAU 1522]|uniref:Response regulator transcription factor n=1 Tax=Thalassococcus arenae TaxID=2851652 RepID=A0ABS6N9B3_9RHOB|nr:response regulator transcription factor [Thalassococcus arenae]MBV2360599.1 response regulator transcription factor [Thalassococcus arenae]
MTRPTAVIADDHALIRQGIRQMLVSGGIDVVAEAADGLEAIAMVKKHQPHLLTLDIAMPYSRGIEVFTEARRWAPQTRIVVFSGLTSTALLGELAHAGADAIFLKREELKAFSDAIPHIVEGRNVLGPGVAELIDASGSAGVLTARELQIVGLVAQGLNNRDMAARLGVSTKTVDNHRTNLMRKVGVHSVAELLAYALREGLLDASRET